MDNKEFLFIQLYGAMSEFNNSPIKRMGLETACRPLNIDADKLRTDLLAFDCHGDYDEFRKKVDRKFKQICKSFNVEVNI